MHGDEGGGVCGSYSTMMMLEEMNVFIWCFCFYSLPI